MNSDAQKGCLVLDLATAYRKSGKPVETIAFEEKYLEVE
jgi:hypothetical protein